MHLIVESILVGIVTVVIGNLVTILIGKQFKVELPDICNTWNKYYVMEISLFLTGFMTHMSMDVLGVNEYYCRTKHVVL
jgi:hypothetical protein